MIKTIQELNNELAKHRKLLNRSVGNQIIPHINYHHYEVIRIIGEINNIESKKDRLSVEGIFNSDIKSLGDDFGKNLRKQFLQMEDEAILKGE